MKGVSEKVSAVLIVLIVASIIGVVYNWGVPLIEKTHAEVNADRVHSYFNPNNKESLQQKIVEVANFGGETTFFMDADGVWTLNNTDNSISFKFFSKVTKIAANGVWVPVFSSTCDHTTTGSLSDPPYITCAQARPSGTGFEITYKVWFRNLSIDYNNLRLIQLNQGGSSSSTSKSLKITQGGTTSTTVGDKTLTIANVIIKLG
jgi:hypothetical protein